MSRTPRRPPSRLRRWFEVLVLLAGLAGVGVWAWSQARMYIYEKRAKQTLEQQRGLRLPGAPQPRLANGALLGQLVIPRLKMDAAVREGAGEGVLSVSLGHIPGTAVPGEPGNIGVAGHRDTLFRGLRNIKANDLIEFQTPAGAYDYRVESTHIVKPSDVDVLKATSGSELTLVTCFPFYYVGPAPDRFIVKARLAAPAAEQAAASRPEPHTRTPLQPKPPVRPVQSAETRQVKFSLSERSSRQIAPGIVLRLAGVDAQHGRANGSIWLAPENRTIWVRNLAVNQPLVFRSARDGKLRQIRFTAVSRDSAAGYFLQAH